MRFRDLPIGDLFEFVELTLPGSYVKVSARCYVDESETKHQVATINVPVKSFRAGSDMAYDDVTEREPTPPDVEPEDEPETGPYKGSVLRAKRLALEDLNEQQRRTGKRLLHRVPPTWWKLHKAEWLEAAKTWPWTSAELNSESNAFGEMPD